MHCRAVLAKLQLVVKTWRPALGTPLSTIAHCLPRTHPPPCPCSNRSAALLALAKTTKALADAEECIRLRPDWDKGHFRKASSCCSPMTQASARMHTWPASVAGWSRPHLVLTTTVLLPTWLCRQRRLRRWSRCPRCVLGRLSWPDVCSV